MARFTLALPEPSGVESIAQLGRCPSWYESMSKELTVAAESATPSLATAFQ